MNTRQWTRTRSAPGLAALAATVIVGAAAHGQPVRHIAPVEPPARAATGPCSEVYANLGLPPAFYYPPGAGVEVLDDLHLGPIPVAEICSFDLGYFLASPGPASATVTLYVNSPGDAPPGAPLATYTVPGLAAGEHLLHVEVPASALTQDVWFGVSFDSDDAGVLLADTPWPGASDDYFVQGAARDYRTFGGNPRAHFVLAVTATDARTGVERGAGTGARAGILVEPSPNPAPHGFRLRFAMPVAGPVRAEVIDVLGRVVARLADRRFAAGEHDLSWGGATDAGPRAAPGVYLLRLSLPGYAASRKLVLLE